MSTQRFGAAPKRGFPKLTSFGLIAIADVLLIIFFQLVLGQDLLSPRTLSTLTPILGVMIIVAMAQAFVIGTGGIDLSLPSIITMMGIIILKQSNGEDASVWSAICLCAVACIVTGILNGVLVEVFGLNSLVTTLATGQLILGVTVLYRGNVLNTSQVPSALSDLARANLGGISLLLLVSLALAIGVAVFVRRFVAGRRLVASSASAQASLLAGLPNLRYRVTAWTISALLAGIGGVLLAGQLGSPDLTLGNPYLLSSIVVVVLGGAVLTGGRVSPMAVVLGAVFIVVLDHGLRVLGASEGLRTFVQGIILAVGLAGAGLLRRSRPNRSADKQSEMKEQALQPRTIHAMQSQSGESN